MLSIKYRPRSLDEVIGNQHIIKFFKTYSWGRPVLLEGETGCGKTTFCYLVAKMFNVAEENIIDKNCVYFSKVDDLRAEIDSLHKTSIFGRRRILILDELHGLVSAQARQVLLKPLENLPADVLVLACTTSTQSLPQTLLDRFIRLRVHPLSGIETKQLLELVMEKEGIKLTKPIMALLLEKSGGIPRRLLTGLEKLRDVSDVKEAEQLLDLVIVEENGDSLELIKHLLSKSSWSVLSKVLDKVLRSNSPEAIRVGLINLIGGRLMSQHLPKEDYLPAIVDVLVDADGYPEKALLVNALFKSHKLVN
jgi:DNA polymerase-3 subunit gamma/tau